MSDSRITIHDSNDWRDTLARTHTVTATDHETGNSAPGVGNTREEAIRHACSDLREMNRAVQDD